MYYKRNSKNIIKKMRAKDNKRVWKEMSAVDVNGAVKGIEGNGGKVSTSENTKDRLQDILESN